MKAKAWVDGGARGNPGPAGWGAYFVDESEGPWFQLWGYLGKTTNNVAEYTGLIEALEEAGRRGIRELVVHTDSQLVERQILGVYRVKQPHLKTLFTKVKSLIAGFERFEIVHVPRRENADADALANRAMDDGAGGLEELTP